MNKNSVKAITMATLDAALLDGINYFPINVVVGVNRVTLPFACFLIRIINISNTSVFISFDGVNTHDYVVAGTSLTLSFQNNASPSNYVAKPAANTMLYAFGAAGVGAIAVAGYYQE
jgi:hypothetical protein